MMICSPRLLRAKKKIERLVTNGHFATDPVMSFLLMGILNVTPDSFYDGARYVDLKAQLERSARMVEEGAHIIDVGGESSRPGSKSISVEEEKNRVLPIIKEMSKRFKNIQISVDTYKSEVAQAALSEGATILNDITAMKDPAMLAVVKKFKPQVVLMHMQGAPSTMQKIPKYKNVVKEVKSYLKKKVEWLLDQGHSRKKIWIDPGIGFGKTVRHNLEILNSLKSFTDIGVPLLIGCSRKSFIGKVLAHGNEVLSVDERLEGSLSAACWAYLNGATIFRVHDVGATNRALSLMEAIQGI